MPSKAELRIKSSKLTAVVYNQEGRVGEISWPQEKADNLAEIHFLENYLWTLIKMALNIQANTSLSLDEILENVEITSENPGDEALGYELIDLVKQTFGVEN